MSHTHDHKAAWLLIAFLIVGGIMPHVPLLLRSFRPRSSVFGVPNFQDQTPLADSLTEVAYPVAEQAKGDLARYWMDAKLAFYQAEGPFRLFDSGDKRCPNLLLKSRCEAFVIP